MAMHTSVVYGVLMLEILYDEEVPTIFQFKRILCKEKEENQIMIPGNLKDLGGSVS